MGGTCTAYGRQVPYRWLQNVVGTMRGDAVGAVPYAPTCYNKLLLLNPQVGATP